MSHIGHVLRLPRVDRLQSGSQSVRCRARDRLAHHFVRIVFFLSFVRNGKICGLLGRTGTVSVRNLQ